MSLKVNFGERLRLAVRAKQNPTVLGLDPRLEYVPEHILEELKRQELASDELIEEAIVRFNIELIDAAADIVPAVKPQIAYYEMYGLAGVRALRRTITHARTKGLLVIADGKRNDIGASSEAYASAWLGKTALGTADIPDHPMFDADALTVNAWLGSDGIKPFLDACDLYGKGIFVLVRTSNPSAAELQDLKLEDGRRVYEAAADMCRTWGEGRNGSSAYGPVGAVVGATWPEQASELRERMPQSFFLVPGYGAQGASADDCAHSFDRDGEGAIVNASRSLMLAWRRRQGFSSREFAEACRAEALDMKRELNQALERRFAR